MTRLFKLNGEVMDPLLQLLGKMDALKSEARVGSQEAL